MPARRDNAAIEAGRTKREEAAEESGASAASPTPPAVRPGRGR